LRIAKVNLVTGTQDSSTWKRQGGPLSLLQPQHGGQAAFLAKVLELGAASLVGSRRRLSPGA
ncbi:MAG: hypothetical protein M0C28_00005, partial [Candidatus Moduliflexus flocculans]|nr:hypothetical protein [Candidatus Moduliflexus flocculans]